MWEFGTNKNSDRTQTREQEIPATVLTRECSGRSNEGSPKGSIPPRQNGEMRYHVELVQNPHYIQEAAGRVTVRGN
jgi:hypothetical protein